MHINSQNSQNTSKRGLGPIEGASRKGMEKLSSGYAVNRVGDATAVLISQKLTSESGSLPLVICSAGKRPLVRAG